MASRIRRSRSSSTSIASPRPYWPAGQTKAAGGPAAFESRGAWAGGDLSGRELPHLGQPEAVAGGIAKPCVDSVRPLLGLLGELDAASLELLVGGPAILCGEEDRPREARRHQASHLVGDL